MVLQKELCKIIFKHKAILLINLIFSCILALSDPFSLYAQAYFIDKVESMIGTKFILSRFVQPSLILLLSFLLPMLNIVVNYISIKYNYSMNLMWNKKMNKMIMNIPYYRYEQEETYNKIKQISENNIYTIGISCLFSMCSVMITIFCYVLILGKISLWLTVSVIILAPAVGYFSSKSSDKQFKKIYKINSDRRRSFYKSSILRSREFVKDIRLNTCADYMLNDWEDTQKSIDSKVLKIKFKYGFLSALIVKTEYIVIFINLIITLLLYINTDISIGVFISISNQVFTMKILPKIEGLISQLRVAKSMWRIYLEVSELTQENSIDKEEICIASPVKIEFKNVSFKYPQQEKFILNDINLQFSSGESVAIVGENGSGKSTLIKLLLGLYIPNKGEILVNNINIRDLSLLEKSKIFGVAFQDFAKFSLPLKQNITLSEDEQDFEQKAQYLKIDDFAYSLRDGYMTLLGKSFGDAIDVSGGEWQKIAILRALIGKKKILVFDEPTASLDPIQEVEMFEKINSITKNIISIFVTHRLGFTKKVDRIILIKNNKIIEDGSFEELMKGNGSFKKIFDIQKDLYIKEKQLNE